LARELKWPAGKLVKFTDAMVAVSYRRLILAEVGMKRFLLVLALSLVFLKVGDAQQSAAGAPASKEDVERYLQVMHSREMMTKMMDAMAKPMHQMIHEQFLKDQDKLPPDFEQRISRIMDDYMKNLPLEEMLQAMVPVYQKHLTKGDIDALVAFYSSPTGQKLIQELPAISAEAMQSMLPLMQKQMAEMTGRIQQEVALMLESSKPKPGQKSPATPN
jgi:hypothetical protein